MLLVVVVVVAAAAAVVAAADAEAVVAAIAAEAAVAVTVAAEAAVVDFLLQTDLPARRLAHLLHRRQEHLRLHLRRLLLRPQQLFPFRK